jgi:hypothetical protein
MLRRLGYLGALLLSILGALGGLAGSLPAAVGFVCGLAVMVLIAKAILAGAIWLVELVAPSRRRRADRA